MGRQDLAKFGSLIARLIHAVSGGDHAPDRQAAHDALVKAMEAGGATVGGALIKCHEGRIWVFREPAGVLGRHGAAALEPLPLIPGQSLLWDRRFIISQADNAPNLEVAPLGKTEDLSAQKALFSGPGEGLSAQPAIYSKGVLIAAPTLLSGEKAGISVKSLAEERFFHPVIRFS